jgi:hypothetical protein
MEAIKAYVLLVIEQDALCFSIKVMTNEEQNRCIIKADQRQKLSLQNRPNGIEPWGIVLSGLAGIPVA